MGDENDKPKPRRKPRAKIGDEPLPGWIAEPVVGGAEEWLPPPAEIRMDGGRTPALTNRQQLDLQVIALCASYFCTQAETAGVLRINIRAFESQLKDTPEVRAAWEWGMARAKASLRRRMWLLAQGSHGSAVTAAIHLAKHVLGETEKAAGENKGDQPSLNFDPAKLKLLSTEELVNLAAIFAKLGGDDPGGAATRAGSTGNLH